MTIMTEKKRRELLGIYVGGTVVVKKRPFTDVTNSATATTVPGGQGSGKRSDGGVGVVVRVEPPASPAAAKEKRQVLPGTNWSCLFCVDRDCEFESVWQLTREGEGIELEWDKMEPDKRGDERIVHMPEKQMAMCVEGLLKSKTFLASNKFVGSGSLNEKLREWLQWRLGWTEREVRHYWIPLRRTAKEVMAYKRHVWYLRIKQVFISKS